MCMWVHMCAYGGSWSTSVDAFQVLSTWFLKQGLFIAWKLANIVPEVFLFLSPQLWDYRCTAEHLYIYSEERTQVLMLVRQTLCSLSHVLAVLNYCSGLSLIDSTSSYEIWLLWHLKMSPVVFIERTVDWPAIRKNNQDTKSDAYFLIQLHLMMNFESSLDVWSDSWPFGNIFPPFPVPLIIFFKGNDLDSDKVQFCHFR